MKTIEEPTVKAKGITSPTSDLLIEPASYPSENYEICKTGVVIPSEWGDFESDVIRFTSNSWNILLLFYEHV